MEQVQLARLFSRIGYVNFVRGVADDASFGSRGLGKLTIVHSSWPTQLDFEKTEETIAGQCGCNCNAPKSGEVDLLQVQHGNGTAIIRWRWLADPQAGVRRAATMGWLKGDCWSIWQEASGV
jgi:hypothetical protein